MRILIAEDDMVGRKVVEHFLKPYGECITAANGEEAFEQFRNSFEQGKRFDLVLLDILMPKREGIEVLRDIRSLEEKHGVNGGKGAKIIMLTGSADAEQINTALTLGVADYLLKPLEERKLLRELQRLGLIDDPDDTWA